MYVCPHSDSPGLLPETWTFSSEPPSLAVLATYEKTPRIHIRLHTLTRTKKGRLNAVSNPARIDVRRDNVHFLLGVGAGRKRWRGISHNVLTLF